jgi:nitroreductase
VLKEFAMHGTDSLESPASSPRGLKILKRLLDVVPARLWWIADDQAAAKPASGSWSIKEELGHLIDSAANNHQRLVLIQVLDKPALPSYDQSGWINAHQYGNKEWEWMIDSWAAMNGLLLSVAESAPPGAWNRTCSIGDSGPLTLEFVLDDYVEHMVHHLTHIGVDVEAALGSESNGYPEKKARPERRIVDLIARRWSPAAFDESRQIERGKILTLLEAARWAPSCFNEQPWRYLVFDGLDRDALERARGCLVEGNAWARKAPVLLLSVAHEDFITSGRPNRHAQHDTGMASENLVLEAARMGLAAHQMAGYDADGARREFNIPERFTPMAMIAIGYPYRGRLDDLPEKIKTREARPRTRRTVAEFAFSATWGTPYKGKSEE